MNKLRPTQKNLDPDGKDYLLLDNEEVRKALLLLVCRYAAWWHGPERDRVAAQIEQLVADAFDAGKDLGASAEEMAELRDELEAEQNESYNLVFQVEHLDELLSSAITALQKHDKKLAGQIQRERMGG